MEHTHTGDVTAGPAKGWSLERAQVGRSCYFAWCGHERDQHGARTVRHRAVGAKLGVSWRGSGLSGVVCFMSGCRQVLHTHERLRNVQRALTAWGRCQPNHSVQRRNAVIRDRPQLAVSRRWFLRAALEHAMSSPPSRR
jgi:hypothetical protein